jgi:hypothetical protein
MPLQRLPMLSPTPSSTSNKDIAAESASLDSSEGVDEAKLTRKIDFRVLPFICIMWLLAFLDR